MAAGAAVAVVALAGLALRVPAARAQIVGKPPQIDFPVLPDPAAPAAAPPIQVQALDATHFVVVTREPRLATKVNQEGPWQQMLVTVVTYYTVQGNKLIPIEHIRVPQGYRAFGQ